MFLVPVFLRTKLVRSDAFPVCDNRVNEWLLACVWD